LKAFPSMVLSEMSVFSISSYYNILLWGIFSSFLTGKQVEMTELFYVGKMWLSCLHLWLPLQAGWPVCGSGWGHGAGAARVAVCATCSLGLPGTVLRGSGYHGSHFSCTGMEGWRCFILLFHSFWLLAAVRAAVPGLAGWHRAPMAALFLALGTQPVWRIQSLGWVSAAGLAKGASYQGQLIRLD